MLSQPGSTISYFTLKTSAGILFVWKVRPVGWMIVPLATSFNEPSTHCSRVQAVSLCERHVGCQYNVNKGDEFVS